MKIQKQHQVSACERSPIELNRLSSAVSNHGYRLIILLLLLLARNLDQIRPSQLEIEKFDARGEFIGDFSLSTGESYLQNTTQIIPMPHTKIELDSTEAMSGNNASSMADFSTGSSSPKRSRRGKRGGGNMGTQLVASIEMVHNALLPSKRKGSGLLRRNVRLLLLRRIRKTRHLPV